MTKNQIIFFQNFIFYVEKPEEKMSIYQNTYGRSQTRKL